MERPDLLTVLEGFQPFAASENKWIADFATLCNEAKHERLTVSIQENARVIARKEGGQLLWEMFKPDGSPFYRHPLMMIDGHPPDGVGEFSARYLSLPAIDEELLWFLDRSVRGVDEIIGALTAAA